MLNTLYSDQEGLYKWIYDTTKDPDEYKREIKDYIIKWERVIEDPGEEL